MPLRSRCFLDQLRRSHLPDRLRFKSKRSEFATRLRPAMPSRFAKNQHIIQAMRVLKCSGAQSTGIESLRRPCDTNDTKLMRGDIVAIQRERIIATSEKRRTVVCRES